MPPSGHLTSAAPAVIKMDIERMFSHHPPKDEETRCRHELLRNAYLDLATLVDAHLVDGPEKTLSIRKLQESLMWGNASIALN